MRKIFSPEDITVNVEVYFISNSIIKNYSLCKETYFQTTVSQITDGCLPIKEIENAEPKFEENGKVSFSHQLTLRKCKNKDYFS